MAQEGRGKMLRPFSFPLFTLVRGRCILRSSSNRPSRKFALMEFSEIRVRQDSYSRLYEP